MGDGGRSNHKGFPNEGVQHPLYYYRDRDSREIDVVIEEDGELHLVEIENVSRERFFG